MRAWEEQACNRQVAAPTLHTIILKAPGRSTSHVQMRGGVCRWQPAAPKRNTPASSGAKQQRLLRKSTHAGSPMSTILPSVFPSDSHMKSHHTSGLARWDEHICQSQTELLQTISRRGLSYQRSWAEVPRPQAGHLQPFSHLAGPASPLWIRASSSEPVPYQAQPLFDMPLTGYALNSTTIQMAHPSLRVWIQGIDRLHDFLDATRGMQTLQPLHPHLSQRNYKVATIRRQKLPFLLPRTALAPGQGIGLRP